MKKRYLLLIFIVLMVLLLAFIYRKQTIPVLGYHSFYKDKSELKEVNPEFINNTKDFEKQIKYLYKHNYRSLSLDEFYLWKKGKLNVKRKSVVITIDDGSLSNYMYAFDILKKYNMKASVFYIGHTAKYYGKEKGSIYDYMSLDLIEKAKKEYPNIKFYSHSYNLHGRAIYDYSDEEIINDVKSMSEIDDFKYYAYPFGTRDSRIKNELKKNNYKLAFGFGPNKEYRKASKTDDDFNIRRLNISNYMSYIKFIIRLNLPF